MQWDPTQYARYADERNRPFFDLVARVGATDPRHVVDLGCGPGTLTAALTERWPTAQVHGIDSSPEMIDRTATLSGTARLTFSLADAGDFDASDVDVLISNALLQWVPGHDNLLRRWSRQLAPGGWLACQVPDNFDSPSHVLMRELAESAAWRESLSGVLRHADAVSSAAGYQEILAESGMVTDVWRTEYLHVLAGDDPVLDWVAGTGLRPVLAALSPTQAPRFRAEYGALLRQAYPRTEQGTVFTFARIFLVGHRTD